MDMSELKRSVSAMTDEELIEEIQKVRNARRSSGTVNKAKKQQSEVDKLLNGMSTEQLEALLASLAE